MVYASAVDLKEAARKDPEESETPIKLEVETTHAFEWYESKPNMRERIKFDNLICRT
jgi:hypothetical protein